MFVEFWGVDLEGRRPLGRDRCSWVVVLKINLKGVGLGGNGLIDLAKDREQEVSYCEHDNAPLASTKQC